MRRSMMMAFLGVLSFTLHLQAADMGFRYRDGRCVDSNGREGLNPYFLGPCSDMRGVIIRGLELTGIDFSGSRFDNAEIQKISFDGSKLQNVRFDLSILNEVNFGGASVQNASFKQATLNKTIFTKADIRNSDFAESTFTESNFTGGKFTSCRFQKVNLAKSVLNNSQWLNSDLQEASFAEVRAQGVSFSGSNLEKTNFQSAQLEQADFSQTSGTAVDFSGANLSTANFINAKLPKSLLRNANLKSAKLQQSDFAQSEFNRADLTGAVVDGMIVNGARYSKRTILPFSAERAKELGMTLVNIKQVYLLWDTMTDRLRAFVAALGELSKGEIEVVMSAMQVRSFQGNVPLEGYDAVLFFVGTSDGYGGDLPDAGQKALVKYVEDGGLFISGEWLAYLVSNNSYKLMRDLILFQRQSGNSGASTLTFTEDGKKDPILLGITSPMSISFHGQNVGPVVMFAQNPVKTLAMNASNQPAIATRNYGKGQVLAFNFACTYEEATCLNDLAVRQIYSNAILNR